MSKFISDLLGMDELSVKRTIARLEHMTVQAGVDSKLTADIITGVRNKVETLGLDSSLTSKEELYYSLREKAKSDGELLREILKISDQDTSVEATKKIADQANKLLRKDVVVTVLPVALKGILKAVPPKKTLKALSFRSIDSVIRREDPYLLYSLARRIEEKTWHKQVNARLKRLSPRDVSEKPVNVISMPKAWVVKLNNIQFDSVIQSVPEIGTILILPSMPVDTHGSVLLSTMLILQAGQKQLFESLPHRANSLVLGLENVVPKIAMNEQELLKPIHGLELSWGAVYQLIAEQSKSRIPDYEFVLGDLEWESSETKLASLHPDLGYWKGTHFLGLNTNSLPVSLHVIDVAASLVLDKDFGQQIVSHMRGSLWNELQLRYLKHESLEKHVVNQLTKDEVFDF